MFCGTVPKSVFPTPEGIKLHFGKMPGTDFKIYLT